MGTLSHLLDNNKAWSGRLRELDPDFFLKRSGQQLPMYLWIGCSDSRVPPNLVVGLEAGELFVHRNIANLVVHTDFNCLTVMQFAVDVLKVQHIIVCGHYGCSGVNAALKRERLGLSDNWLRHLVDIQHKHARYLAGLGDPSHIPDRLCELNIIEQVVNVSQTSIARDAWERGQELEIHGWIYGISDGLLRDMNVTISGYEETPKIYHSAISALCPRKKVPIIL